MKKVSRGVGILCKLRACMSVELLKIIYYTLVYSHLQYGVHVWGSACPTVLDKILILQKKAVRAMTGNRWYQTYGNPGPLATSDPLFQELEILKIGDIYKLNVAKFIFSCLSHLNHPKFWTWFKINADDHALKSSTTVLQKDYFDVGIVSQSLTLHLRRFKTESYGAKMIQVLGPVIWNDLPANIRDSDSIQIFSKHLKLFLVSCYLQAI